MAANVEGEWVQCIGIGVFGIKDCVTLATWYCAKSLLAFGKPPPSCRFRTHKGHSSRRVFSSSNYMDIWVQEGDFNLVGGEIREIFLQILGSKIQGANVKEIMDATNLVNHLALHISVEVVWIFGHHQLRMCAWIWEWKISMGQLTIGMATTIVKVNTLSTTLLVARSHSLLSSHRAMGKPSTESGSIVLFHLWSFY